MKIKKVWCVKVKVKCLGQNEVKVTTWEVIVLRTCKLHFAKTNLNYKRYFYFQAAWEIYSSY